MALLFGTVCLSLVSSCEKSSVPFLPMAVQSLYIPAESLLLMDGALCF